MYLGQGEAFGTCGRRSTSIICSAAKPSSRLRTTNCIIIGHFSAFEFDWSPCFSRRRLKNGWQWVKTARKLNLGVSRNRFCDFLADPDSRSFSRFGAIIMQFAVVLLCPGMVALITLPSLPIMSPMLYAIMLCDIHFVQESLRTMTRRTRAS